MEIIIQLNDKYIIYKSTGIEILGTCLIHKKREMDIRTKATVTPETTYFTALLSVSVRKNQHGDKKTSIYIYINVLYICLYLINQKNYNLVKSKYLMSGPTLMNWLTQIHSWLYSSEIHLLSRIKLNWYHFRSASHHRLFSCAKCKS